jgi:signal peptide peptidase SppA
MSKFARVSQRLFNVPLILRPEKCEMLCAALVDRLGIAKLDRIDGTSLGAAQLRQQAFDDWGEARPKTARDMYSVESGVARISIDGTTVHKLGGVEPYSGMVGYDCLARIVTDARANKEVSGILLDMDTPGGEVSGCFEFARLIYDGSARYGGKPIFAFANEMACSAGYAIASACDKIATTDTGVVGSIGVWTMIVDLTKALDKNGVEVRMIRAGDRKARGGPYEKADDPTIAKLQGWVEQTWSMFADIVGQCRDVDPAKVLGWEGDWFTGAEALDLGLIDAVDSPDAIFEALVEASR